MADNMNYGAGIDVASLLLARGVGGGYGGGYGGFGGHGGYGGSYGGGNSFLAAEAHANGTAVKEAIDGNRDLFNVGIDRISAQNKEGRDNFLFSQTLKAIADTELRSLDRQRDIERLIGSNATEFAKCCCETQKLIVSESTQTRELILEVEGRANIRLLDAANAKITQLETINALSGNGHHGG
jgi:hypothetical protein